MRAQPLYAPSFRDIAHHFGPLRALQLLALKALRIRPVVLLSWEAAGPTVPPQGSDGVRPATPADAGLFDQAGFSGMLQRKLADGPGWIKLDQDRLVAWCFLGLTRSEVADWLVVLTGNSTALWGAGSWVQRDYRGGGLAGQVRRHSAAWYREQGYREQFSWINLTNYSSLRSWYKQGGRAIGRITCFRLFGIALVHDGRHWHLGRWTASRPLVLSMESIRLDRPRRTAGYESETPRSSAARGLK